MAGLALQYKSHGTMLERINPFIKLLLMIVLSIAFSSYSGISLYIGFSLLVIIGYSSKIKLLRELMKMPMLLLIALVVAISEYIATNELSASFGKFVSFLSIISLAVIFTSSTDIIELSGSIGAVLSPLIGKKGWRFASYIMMTIALFPMIFQTASTMLQSRRSRCGSFFSHPLRNLSEYTISLVKLLFRNAAIFEDALLARAFNPDAKRNAEKPRICDTLLLVCVLIVTLIPFLLRKLS